MTHVTNPLLLELLVIFVCAKLFGELFNRMRLPPVLGEILAGIVLGPFGFVPYVQIHPSATVQAVAGIGAIFLLFSVGLSTRPAELLNVGRSAMRVAVGGILVPFILGIGFLLAIGYKGHESIFVATAMVATSVGITARVLSDLNVLHTRAARIVMAAAVFDDILGMILLAIVGGLVAESGIHWVELTIVIAEAAGFAIFMMFFAPRVIGRMRGGIGRMHTRNAPMVLALTICMAFSVAAERVGMAAIIGAFFAGLAFADQAPEWRLLERVDGITELLTPFFFFVMGARLNIEVFNGGLLWTAAAISLIAVIAKVLGCGVPVLPEGWRMALRVGVGMVPRGEVGLIVALVGLNANIISESAYALVISMTGFTTLVAPLLLRAVFSDERAPRSEVAASPASPLANP